MGTSSKYSKKNTGVQNYNTEKYTPPLRHTDTAKKRESKDGGEKDSENTKEGEGGRMYK